MKVNDIKKEIANEGGLFFSFVFFFLRSRVQEMEKKY